MKIYKRGFSLPEILIVLTILGILFSLTTINLLGVYSKNSLDTSLNVLVGDLRQQQLKAMVGDTEGSSSHSAYGIYLLSDRYILFKGPSYSASDANNFEIILGGDLEFSSIIVPDQQVVFASGSGDLANYDSNFNYITLKNTQTDETKTVRLNNYGTINDIY